jgi:UDP:flavonoid glycosyltransferase YjiC (YdhE family)
MPAVRILFSSGPMYGHVNALLPLALAARDAGHTVIVATGPELLDHVARHGLATWSIGRTHEASGGRAALSPQYFVDTGTHRAADLVPLARRWRPDLVVHEEMELAGAVAAATTGARHAVHALSLRLPTWVWDTMAPIVGELARPWISGAEAPDVFGATYLRIDPPSLRVAEPGQWADVRAVRPGFGRPADDDRPPAGLDEFLRDGADPVVHLTLGTVFHESPGVFREALTGLRELPVRVVATTGPRVAPSSLGPQPANVRVVPYVPHALLLPSCALVVAHAGSGITFGALAHGLPQLLLPQGADQFDNAAACAAAGVATVLPPDGVDAAAVADAAGRMLADADADAARRAAAIGDELAAMPGPADVIADLTAGGAAAA